MSDDLKQRMDALEDRVNDLEHHVLFSLPICHVPARPVTRWWLWIAVGMFGLTVAIAAAPKKVAWREATYESAGINPELITALVGLASAVVAWQKHQQDKSGR